MFLVVLGIKPRVSLTHAKHSPADRYPQPSFNFVSLFEIGSPAKLPTLDFNL